MPTMKTKIDRIEVAEGHSNKRPSRAKARRQEKALEALANFPTHEKAARAIGISSRTLRRYLQEPEFQARLRQRGQEQKLHRDALLLEGAPRAAAVMRSLMSPEVPPRVRFNAAKYVLDNSNGYQPTESRHNAEGNQGGLILLHDRLSAARQRLAKHRESEKQRAAALPAATALAQPTLQSNVPSRPNL